jgi:HSP20 family molecular chaperone IbpA
VKPPANTCNRPVVVHAVPGSVRRGPPHTQVMKEGDAAMLLRFDPFRDIDRLANEILGAPRVPQPMPMDCYRHGDTFFLHFDLPGIDIDTLEVTEENNTLTVRAAGAGQKTISGQTTEGDQPAGATTS